MIIVDIMCEGMGVGCDWVREFAPSHGWGGAIGVYLAALPSCGMVAVARIELEGARSCIRGCDCDGIASGVGMPWGDMNDVALGCLRPGWGLP